jgi:hypothetical protein
MVIGYDPAATAAAIAQQNFASLYTLNGLYGGEWQTGAEGAELTRGPRLEGPSS